MRKHKGFSAEDYTNNFLGKGTRVVVLAIMIIMVLFPLYWLASNSIKTSAEYLKNPPVIVPSKVREQLGEEFVVTKGLDGCLFVYPKTEWEGI